LKAVVVNSKFTNTPSTLSDVQLKQALESFLPTSVSEWVFEKSSPCGYKLWGVETWKENILTDREGA
jgi:hypothetical protein